MTITSLPVALLFLRNPMPSEVGGVKRQANKLQFISATKNIICVDDVSSSDHKDSSVSSVQTKWIS